MLHPHTQKRGASIRPTAKPELTGSGRPHRTYFYIRTKGQTIVVHSVGIDRFNDPSAGSPTETLLRLLLPLNGRV